MWWPVLVQLRDQLAALEGVATCRIGLEPDLTPDDYPIVRLVPSVMRAAAGGQARVRTMDLLVYLGAPVQGFDDSTMHLAGTEEVYAALFDLEARIVAALKTGDGYGIRHLETVTDEDRLAAYKLMAARFEVAARNPAG